MYIMNQPLISANNLHLKILAFWFVAYIAFLESLVCNVYNEQH